ncbi:HNH endonuclease signature motif containing protein [Lacisediminihabitans changchengi]|uniref:DUF222 domain-containing protein n=1 Tax=Lacisediminihabitans changchengi TaxID=2787634 RepID=A0A934W2I7_9MICO|nr:HNH endonuclease signature motif containing protein [Lacisediminihabitans changchengi]MBK4346919.1 DUF222 domain-containing protein [Lacisediminihabitans changchengi]MBK4347958.1 DUF222 domain-containing protein [Lacisediminihabitans changchengi]
MENSPATLLADLSEVCADGFAGVAGVASDQLLRMVADSGTVQRAVDAIRVTLAGEVVERSAPHLGAEGMARQAGHSRPATFLAELWQISIPEAARLCDLGTATRSKRALDGSPLPARYPAVAAAVADLSLGVEAAVVIVRELDLAAPFCSTEARLAGERLLVEHAPGLTVKQIAGVARQVRDRLDEDGAESRDVIRRQRRALSWVTEPDGMVRLVWVMPPETAGLVRAGIDQLVSEQLRAARDAAPAALADTGFVDSDDRTMPHRRADAAEDLFRQAVNCTCGAGGGGGGGPLVTVIVRMSLDQLVTGLGTAQIDGIDAGISATRARIMAADANIIPAVLGGTGEVLDLGRSRRLFSPAQRQALAETYGGCAFPACGHPPSYTEAHHLQWWSSGGVTDLDNGIPLCSFHHHRIHDDGWEIVMREQVPYFIPPPWIDPDQTPRQGGIVVIAM